MAHDQQVCTIRGDCAVQLCVPHNYSRNVSAPPWPILNSGLRDSGFLASPIKLASCQGNIYINVLESSVHPRTLVVNRWWHGCSTATYDARRDLLSEAFANSRQSMMQLDPCSGPWYHGVVGLELSARL